MERASTSEVDALESIFSFSCRYSTMASADDRDMIEFTIKSNVVTSEAIRRFKRSIRIDEMKVIDR